MNAQNTRSLWESEPVTFVNAQNTRSLWESEPVTSVNAQNTRSLWEKESLRESQPSKLAVGSQIVSHILRMWRLIIYLFNKYTNFHNFICNMCVEVFLWTNFSCAKCSNSFLCLVHSVLQNLFSSVCAKTIYFHIYDVYVIVCDTALLRQLKTTTSCLCDSEEIWYRSFYPCYCCLYRFKTI